MARRLLRREPVTRLPAFHGLASVLLVARVAGAGAVAPPPAFPPALGPPSVQAVAPPADAATPTLALSPLAPEGGAVRALAREAGTGRIAVAAGRGVLVREADGRVGPVLQRGVASALAFEPGGALWIGTENGLVRIDTEGRHETRAVAPGTEARGVLALAVDGAAVVVGTQAGAFASLDGGRFTALSGGLRAGPVSAVALFQREVWLVSDGELWNVAFARDGEGARAVREPVFDGGAGSRCVDVTVGLPGAEVVALGRDAFALRDAKTGGWQTLRPSLPPGASALRLAFAVGRYWLATDRGLLEAERLEGPWRRAAGEVGSEPVAALSGDASGLFAGAGDGLWVSAAATPREGQHSTVWVDAIAPQEPRIEAVQRAALTYLDLGPERIQGLKAGAAHRGLLPVLALRLDRGSDRFRRRNYDETFASGDTRPLHDLQRDSGRDYGATLSLEWDLGDAAFHPDEIDVSKEAREVIELRDDVLDEVTQLYFERQRVLLQLSTADSQEALRLRLRADELAAGLNAWTGGWFGRHAVRLTP